MTGTQKIVIGVAVLGALGFAVFKQQQRDEQIGVVKDKPADLPEIKGSDDLDKLVIINAEKGEVTLEKKGDKWMVTKPVNALANQGAVKSMLDNMKELKVTDLVDPAATDDVKKSYQLDAAHGVHVIGFKGAEKKVDDVFGKQGGRGQIVMVGDKPALYVSSGYSSYLYAKELKAWRDTEIFKFDDANVTSITISKKDSLLSFTKGDKWAGTAKGKAIDRLDEDKIKSALGTFKSLNAEDFGDGKPPSETGLDAPEATVTISLKDNAGKYVLGVGKPAAGTNRYAQKEGDPTIYQITSGAVDWAMADTQKFQRALDAGAPKDAGPAMMPPHGMPGMGGMGMPPGMGGMPPGHP